MQKYMTNNMIGAAGIMVITLIYLYEAWKLPLGSLEWPGVGFTPMLFGMVLLGICLLLILGELLSPSIRKPPSLPASVKSSEAEAVEETKTHQPVMGFMTILLAYPLALNFFGFLISTIPFLYISLRVMGHQNRFVAIAFSVLLTVFAKYMFEWLGVFFPQGTLW